MEAESRPRAASERFTEASKRRGVAVRNSLFSTGNRTSLKTDELAASIFPTNLCASSQITRSAFVPLKSELLQFAWTTDMSRRSPSVLASARKPNLCHICCYRDTKLQVRPTGVSSAGRTDSSEHTQRNLHSSDECRDPHQRLFEQIERRDHHNGYRRIETLKCPKG